ncbi:putative membrane protein [Bradyrhizobium sp. USDA 4369]
MTKMMLIGAMVLASATTAQAGGTRSLSLSPGDTAAPAPRPAYVQQAGEVTITPAPAVAAGQPATQPVQPAPAAAAPVSNSTPATQPAAAAAPTPDPTGSVQNSSRRSTSAARSARAGKPRGKSWTEARIIRELHRHGIYW